MSNLDITQRKSLERSTLSGNDSLRHGTERGSAIYSIIAILIGGVLGYAALTTIDSWSQWLVLGVIVITTIGAMIALSPNRRG
jgi:uncharacterized membrane protein YeaQ/YmgE (transglycosylase-associated protein family)